MKQVVRFALPAIALALLGAGCALFPQVVRVPTPPPTNSGTAQASDTAEALAYLELNGGAATITRGGTTVAGQSDTELASGDRIQVSAGTVSLVYPDAGETQLDAGSDATIVFDGPDTGSVFDELQVTAGDAWTRFERLLGSNEHFSVQANGVVATVRGTGFGVSVNGDDVDVQVAEHTVEVTSADEEAGTAPAQAMQVTAGQEIHMLASNFKKMGIQQRRSLVKAMAKEDMKKNGFQFAVKNIPPGQLKKPVKPVKLQIAPGSLSQPLLQRMETIKKLMTVEEQLKGFAAPTAAPGTLSPVGTPSVNGPTGTLQ